MIQARTLLSALSLSVLLCGCATSGDYAEQGHEANLAIEQTQNNMLLVNAIRAYQRKPMHFTTMGTVKAPIGNGVPSFTFGLPALGPDRDGKRLLSPSATYKPDTPNFDMTVWDGQNFIRGITAPVEPKTFVYYLDQGWPMQLLVHLLIREIRVVDKDGVVKQHYLNYPEDSTQYEAFKKAALTLSNCEFVFAKKKNVVEYGPRLTVAGASDPVAIAKIKEQGLLLEPETSTVMRDGKEITTILGYQIVKEEESQVLKLIDRPMKKGVCKPFHLEPQTLFTTTNVLLEKFAAQIFGLPLDNKSKPPTHVIALSMRSPEAALYHLGELTRAQLEGAYRDGKRDQRMPFDSTVDLGIPPEIALVPLFVVSKDRVPAGVRPAAVAKYDGVTYWISPDPDVAGRSMRLITLVHQLINMQKDAKDLPATTTIRITQ